MARVTCLHAKYCFDYEFPLLRRDMNAIQEGVESILGSRKLHAVQKMILKIGNFLNQGTRRGNV